MNIRYAIYDTNTGKINRWGFCEEEQIGLQYKTENEEFLLGEYDQTYQVNLTTLTPYKITFLYPDMPVYSLYDVVNYIASDELLNKAIENLGENVTAYRLLHWFTFRSKAYPPMTDYLDGQAKLSDPALAVEGQLQIQKYLDDCIAVKQRFPKPTGDE